jgi:Sulfotransferase domain
MMLKYLGVGLSRTGTTSVANAMGALGLNVIHWAPERLSDVVEGRTTNPTFRRYDDVDAVLDLPAALFSDELTLAYPGLKLILTIRDEDQWWRSVSQHYRRVVFPNGYWRHSESQLAYGSDQVDEFIWRKRYREHNQRIIATTPPDRLLIMDLEKGDGWLTLCNFLGCDAPDYEFPWTNRG